MPSLRLGPRPAISRLLSRARRRCQRSLRGSLAPVERSVAATRRLASAPACERTTCSGAIR